MSYEFSLVSEEKWEFCDLRDFLPVSMCLFCWDSMPNNSILHQLERLTQQYQHQCKITRMIEFVAWELHQIIRKHFGLFLVQFNRRILLVWNDLVSFSCCESVQLTCLHFHCLLVVSVRNDGNLPSSKLTVTALECLVSSCAWEKSASTVLLWSLLVSKYLFCH